MSSTSPQQVDQLLGQLRRLFVNRHPPAAAIAHETALFAEALQDLDPRHLTAAVKAWLRTGSRMPYPADLRKLAEAEAEREQAKTALATPRLTAHAELGATMRNEAITLLGELDCLARRLLGGAETDEYRVFLGEVANRWQADRPPGGLRELDSQRSGRFRVGHALEVWARERLGVEPSPTAAAGFAGNIVADTADAFRRAAE